MSAATVNEAAAGLAVLTPDGIPEGEEASAALARASRQADELAGLLERVRLLYEAVLPRPVARVLALTADQLGGMHVEFDMLAEDCSAAGSAYRGVG